MTPLFLSAFLLNTGLTVTLIGIIFYLIDRFHAGLFQLGLLSGIGSFVFMSAAWLCGKFFSRRYTAKALTRFGICCFILGFLFIPHLPSLRWVYLIYPIGSFGMGIFWPSLERWISSESDGGALKQNMSLFNLSWSPGQIIAPFLAGVLFEREKLLPIRVGVLLALPILFLLSFASEKKGLTHATDSGGKTGKPPKLLVICWLSNFAGWFAGATFRSLFPTYGLSMNLSPTCIGAFLLLIGVGQVLFFFVLSRKEGWEKRPGFFLVWEGIALVSILAIAVAYQPVVWMAAFFLFGCFTGAAYSGSILLSVKDSRTSARYAGFHETTIGLAVCLGPFLGGTAGSVFGVRAPYVVSAVALGSVMVTQWQLLKE